MASSCDIKIGDTFPSLDLFQLTLKARERYLGEKWKKGRRLRTIAVANKMIADTKLHFKRAFVYSYATFECFRYGQFAHKGNFIRRRSSNKCGCNVFIKISANRKVDALVVKDLHLEHNHPLTVPKVDVGNLSGITNECLKIEPLTSHTTSDEDILAGSETIVADDKSFKIITTDRDIPIAVNAILQKGLTETSCAENYPSSSGASVSHHHGLICSSIATVIEESKCAQNENGKNTNHPLVVISEKEDSKCTQNENGQSTSQPQVVISSKVATGLEESKYSPNKNNKSMNRPHVVICNKVTKVQGSKCFQNKKRKSGQTRYKSLKGCQSKNQDSQKDYESAYEKQLWCQYLQAQINLKRKIEVQVEEDIKLKKIKQEYYKAKTLQLNKMRETVMVRLRDTIK